MAIYLKLCMLLVYLPLLCESRLDCHDPCMCECHCETVDDLEIPEYKALIEERYGIHSPWQEKRFVASCTTSDSRTSIPKNLPRNTTDLIVENYHIGSLHMDSFCFTHVPMLIDISLKNCGINSIFRGAFDGKFSTFLSTIVLSNNTLSSFDGFRDLDYLESISLDGNSLQSIKKSAFRNLPVVAINLSHNAINKIEEGAFDNLTHLKRLDLSFNDLTIIPGREISKLPSLQNLYLSGNKWNCSCDMSWVLNHSSILVQSQGKCEYPSSLNGTLLHQVNMSHFQHCLHYNILLSQRSILLISVVIIASIIILSKYYSAISEAISSRIVDLGSWVTIGRIKFCNTSRHALGNKRNVFKGEFQEISGVKCKCAIKVHTQNLNDREIEIFQLLRDNPPNPHILQYLGMEKDCKAKKTYIALCLCDGTLDGAIDLPRIYSFLTADHCLAQITDGIKYLHQLKIQHRDIKPQNILWKDDGNNEIRFIISDFDLCHAIGSSSHRAPYGTLGWMAPELSRKKKRTTAVDIFSLGCVFYYVLTLGDHPFRSDPSIKPQDNISDDKFSLSALNLCKRLSTAAAAFAKDLITQMISQKSSERPNATDVLKHPLFWTRREIMNYYIRFSKKLQSKDTPGHAAKLRSKLEDNTSKVFKGSWSKQLDKMILDDIKFKTSNFKFDKDSHMICDLLQVICNKSERYGELPEKLRAAYFGSEEGVAEYYNMKFPKLLPYIYRVEQSTPCN